MDKKTYMIRQVGKEGSEVKVETGGFQALFNFSDIKIRSIRIDYGDRIMISVDKPFKVSKDKDGDLRLKGVEE